MSTSKCHKKIKERERERERGFPYKCKLRINKNWGHQSVMT